MEWTNLNGVLAPIRYAVVGGVATRLYMPERFTQDLDVVILANDAAQAHEKLTDASFTKVGVLSLVQGTIWRAPNTQEIDVIEGKESWWTDAIIEAQDNRDQQKLPILPLPYLILMKYLAGRAQDLADIERMIGQASEADLNRTRALFKAHAPNDLEDLESMIALGKLG
jgi:hypothetical protein